MREPKEDLWKTDIRAWRMRNGTASTTSCLFPSAAAGRCTGRSGGSWARSFMRRLDDLNVVYVWAEGLYVKAG